MQSELADNEALNWFSRECARNLTNNWTIAKGSLFDHGLDRSASRTNRAVVTVNVNTETSNSGNSLHKEARTPTAYRSVNEVHSFSRLNIPDEAEADKDPEIDANLLQQSTDEAVTAVQDAMKVSE